MGNKCDYLDLMSAVPLYEGEDVEKKWLSHYGDMPEKLEYHQGSIYDMLLDAVNEYPDYPAMEFFGITQSFREFFRNIEKVSCALVNIGVKENESVTICMPNIPEAIYLIYAINKIGAICNVIHPLSSHEEIAEAMKSTQSTLIFTTDASVKNVNGVHGTIVVCDVSTSMNAVIKTAYNLKNRKALKYPHHMVRWADFLKSKVVSAKPAVRGKDDPAVIIYSGGTTGKSKGIVLSNLCFNSLSTQCYAVCKEARPGNSILSALPIFHGFGLCVSIHVPLTLGLKCILLPKINVGELNSIIKKKKPNLLPVIPTMLNAMAKTPPISPTSLSSVKVILSGGDYLSDSVREKVLSYFKAGGADTHIQVGYGLSEATAFIAATSDNIAETDNIGIPNPDNIIKICDPDTNEELPDGEIGEICVNGPTVMMGYINEKEETENAIRKHSDGITYLHTGDLGFMKDGVLHFTSRLKRMIISNGYNIYPTELENIINKCKYVASNVVVGVKDKVRQEAPKVVIVLKNGVQRTAEIEKEIVEFCKKNIAKNAQPTEYEFTDALPTTKIGKINYRQFENKEKEDNK